MMVCMGRGLFAPALATRQGVKSPMFRGTHKDVPASPWKSHLTILRPHIARSVRASASKNDPINFIRKEMELQSPKLSSNIRDRVEAAIEQLGYRATIGDVAARAGVKVSEAEEALKALAFDSLGSLEVSAEGEVLFVFPLDFRQKIRNRSLLLRAQPVLQAVQSAAWYMLRVSFGAALFTSVVIASLAIIVLLSSRDDNDRRRSGGGGGMNIWFNVSDLFYYFDPYYYRTQQERRMMGEQMSFLEAVFSFVFGDGDPNSDLEERRWKELGRLIQSKGGVVTAEEMAPYLEPPEPSNERGANPYEDEGFVVPALVRLGGEPMVDEKGQLLYVFPSLQKTAQSKIRTPSSPVLLENEWELTAASAGQLTAAVLLGVANVAAVFSLSAMLTDPYNQRVLLVQGYGFVLALMPYLQLYAAAFFGIPLIRGIVNAVRNAAVDARNSMRLAAAQLVRAPPPALTQKLKSARQEAKQKMVKQQDVVYSTERGVDEQLAGRDLEDFDRKLRRSEGKRWGERESTGGGERLWDEAVEWGGKERERERTKRGDESRFGDWR